MFNDFPEFAGAERFSKNDLMAFSHGRGTGQHGVHMKERQEAEKIFVFVRVQRRVNAVGIGNNIFIGQQYAFWISGGARSIKDKCDVFGIGIAYDRRIIRIFK